MYFTITVVEMNVRSKGHNVQVPEIEWKESGAFFCEKLVDVACVSATKRQKFDDDTRS